MVHKHDAHEHDGIPDANHGGIGTSAGIRLVDRINTWKAFVGLSALCLVIDGLLFYLR
jgi:hypothetical protein